MIWRPILAQITTLEEVQTHWSINDLMDAHEALDIKDEIEEFHHKQAKNSRD